MGKNKNKRKKRKLDKALEDIRELLERIHQRLGEKHKQKADYKLRGTLRTNTNKQGFSNEPRNIPPKRLEQTSTPRIERISFPPPSKEPKPTVPKERLIYDPEVKRLLQKIEDGLKKLSNKEEAKPEETEEKAEDEKLEAINYIIANTTYLIEITKKIKDAFETIKKGD